jgi:hypothetical protein
VTAPGSKPCASCGAEVADAALGRGAIEDPDGRRYCSPCAAKLLRSDHPEADALKAVAVARPSSANIIPAASSPRRNSSTRTVPPRAKTTRVVGKQSSRSVKRAEAAEVEAVISAAPTARAVPAAPAIAATPKVAVPAGAATAKSAAPAKRPSSTRRNSKSARMENADAQVRVTQSQRISRRISARSGLPWYTRFSRAQIIGLFVGVGVVVLGAIVVLLMTAGYRKNNSRPQAVVTDRPTRARQLILDADRLMEQGRRDEALRKLREAVADAKAAGHEELSVEANRKINAINKGTVINAN